MSIPVHCSCDQEHALGVVSPRSLRYNPCNLSRMIIISASSFATKTLINYCEILTGVDPIKTFAIKICTIDQRSVPFF